MMNFFKNSKKPGFTLMEIAIAVLIVAILVGVTGLVVKEQLKKSAQYSYYLAYRSVEKMAGQIAALPDSIAENEQANKIAHSSNISEKQFQHFLKKNSYFAKNEVKLFFITMASKIAYSEGYFFKRLFPKTLAGSTTKSTIYTSDVVDELVLMLKVCSGEQIVNPDAEPIVNEDGSTTPVYYTKDDFKEDDYDGCAEDNLEGEVSNLFGNDNCFDENPESADSVIASARSGLTSGAITSESLCHGLVTDYCTPYVDANTTLSVSYSDGTCYMNKSVEYDQGGNDPGFAWDRPAVDPNACSTSYGYYNMYNSAPKDTTNNKQYFINCQCLDGYEISNNDARVCCPITSELGVSYSKSNTSDKNNKCIKCTTDFDIIYNTCCPEHSVYSGVKDTANSTACSCVEGYKMQIKDGKPYCKQVGCSGGAIFDEVNGVCITKPNIIKGKNFCESIAKYWNVSSSNCGGWTKSNDVEYNKPVFDAATGTNGKFLSVVSKDGAFANLTPNVVLANGLKIWVLSDKSASIPGLSYNPQAVTPSQNVCKPVPNKTNYIDCYSATGGKGYFCKNENNCYALDERSLTVGKMTDARNCCGTLDLTNIAIKDEENYQKQNVAFAISGFTVFVDIDGQKGTGTLWEDIFPFYIGANGTVYPGYPLDGTKKENTSTTSLYVGGNDASSLPTDVYYFDTDTATNKARKKIIVYPAVSFARAACQAKIVSQYTPYCMNLGERFNDPHGTNPCNSHKCFIGVRNKLRIF